VQHGAHVGRGRQRGQQRQDGLHEYAVIHVAPAPAAAALSAYCPRAKCRQGAGGL